MVSTTQRVPPSSRSAPTEASASRQGGSASALTVRIAKRAIASSAASLTMDSNAIAATIPGWLSSALRRRVPKAMTKKAISAAVQNAVSACEAASPTSAAKERLTAMSWSAM